MKTLIESLLDNEDDLIFNADKVLIDKFLQENYFISGEYVIRNSDTGKYIIDVEGSVFFMNNSLNSLTNDIFEFGEVTRDFYCDQRNTYNTKLKTLKGAPKYVDGIFDCSTCLQLVSLEGGPQYCKKFQCLHCRSLANLKGAPKMCNDFCCDDCDNLKTLEGAPKYVDNFSCRNCNHLKDLKGSPKAIQGRFDCVCCMNLISITGCPKKCETFSCRGSKRKITKEEVRSLCNAKYIYI